MAIASIDEELLKAIEGAEDAVNQLTEHFPKSPVQFFVTMKFFNLPYHVRVSKEIRWKTAGLPAKKLVEAQWLAMMQDATQTLGTTEGGQVLIDTVRGSINGLYIEQELWLRIGHNKMKMTFTVEVKSESDETRCMVIEYFGGK